MKESEKSLETLNARIRGGLIVSCQAPADSPLARPEIIAALAATAEQNGAVAVRIDSPVNIAAVRKAVRIPIIGIYKMVDSSSDVYITPTYQSALEVAEAGADMIALDATSRARPGGESLPEICFRIRESLRLPLMADVATFVEGDRAAGEIGCDFVGTTLSGYTVDTEHLQGAPDFELIAKLAGKIGVPVIAEGRLASPEHVSRAFEAGALAVVVGNAITGIDSQIRRFVSMCPGSVEKT